MCSSICLALRAADYHLSPEGSDENPGTSPDRAWKTLAKANAATLAPGDKILLQGGATFEGTLEIKHSGTPEKPILVSSYSNGRATIQAGTARGILAKNQSGIEISNLIVSGAGADKNKTDGIAFLSDRATGERLPHIRIDKVKVSGFGQSGITIEAEKQIGFRDVRITNVSAHDNGFAGINSGGYCPLDFKGWSHADVYVGHCTAFNNLGIPEKMENHSGNGIIMGGIDGLSIERCMAYENGRRCNAKVGGPVGIWAWDSTRVIIQHNISHHNKTGKGSIDGGGFDFDGGVTHSIMQYNYSYENDGAGYLICQYDGARPFHDNVVRYNISHNDGRAHGYGGIHIYSHKPGELKRIDVYQNTIVISPPASGTPAAVHFQTAATEIRFLNNLFVSSGGVPLVKSGVEKSGALFAGNAYWSGTDVNYIEWNKKKLSLADWRKSSAQEMFNGVETGRSGDPLFSALILKPSLEDAARMTDRFAISPLNNEVSELSAYRLGKESTLRQSGLDIKTLFKIESGKDFFGASPGAKPDPGFRTAD